MGGDSGVFLGIERPDWAFAQPPSARSSVYAVTGDNISVTAGRLSFVLGLQGPCSSVDTACASALTAVHGASHAVRSRECRCCVARRELEAGAVWCSWRGVGGHALFRWPLQDA